MIRFYFSLQYFLIFCAFLFLQFHYNSPAHAQTTVKSGIIPLPVSVKILPGNFELSNATHITWNNPDDAATASIFHSQLKQQYSIVIHEEANSNLETNVIRMQRINAGELPAEGYRISIDENKIIIQAKDGAGIFYALQSLLQLCPPVAASGKLLIPKTILIDYPRFNWRGMHLDVARHFFSKEQVKKYIDYLAAYKFNTFHWHLTDDQGWRIEIKKYPLLTSVGAWRDGTLIGHYSNQPQFDSIRYGGFYSQEDIREVVAYAQKRFITIVPEIEMPGHVLALLSAYPELACSGSSFNVAKNWGVFNDVLCPTEETISFMQNVLLEVMELFPSKYIHIGGDECPKEQWQKSVYCQNLMQQLGLKNENALQGYFTRRIETFVSAHGRSIIGWDEILEDGLSTSAAVMSWRGIDGGTAAASSNHNVVMSPTDFCYFDYYQSQNTHEPLAIGGYVPLEKVYAFEPMPPALATDKQSFIMGGQANVWTEYIESFSKLQYMIFPRICAMSEVLWSQKENRNYADFVARLSANHFPEFNAAKINYSKAILEAKFALRPNENGAGIIGRLYTDDPSATINYNLSSYENEILSATNNTQFERGPIDLLITHSVIMNIKSKDVSGNLSAENVQQLEINKATARNITLLNPPDPKYSNGGPFTLVNGIVGHLPWNGSEWLGFSGKNIEAMVDLGKSEMISKISLGVLDDEGSWIYLPQQVTVSISSDGKTFRTVGTKNNEAIKKTGGRKATFTFTKTTARYIKIIAVNAGNIPAGKAGSGNPAWLFADEIGIE